MHRGANRMSCHEIDRFPFDHSLFRGIIQCAHPDLSVPM
jgi:hypothetical protein